MCNRSSTVGPISCSAHACSVNGNLAPLPPGADPRDGRWQLSEKGLRRCLRALTADLGKALEDESGRLRITKAYGVDGIVDLADFVKTLEK